MPEVVSLYPGRPMRDFRFLSFPSTKFLLQEGMEFVLTERFCQDPEEYFGNQLKLGQQSENCPISSFGYNNSTIRIQRAVSCQSGNTRGRKDRSKAWEHITDIPVRCQKKFRPS